MLCASGRFLCAPATDFWDEFGCGGTRLRRCFVRRFAFWLNSAVSAGCCVAPGAQIVAEIGCGGNWCAPARENVVNIGCGGTLVSVFGRIRLKNGSFTTSGVVNLRYLPATVPRIGDALTSATRKLAAELFACPSQLTRPTASTCAFVPDCFTPFCAIPYRLSYAV